MDKDKKEVAQPRKTEMATTGKLRFQDNTTEQSTYRSRAQSRQANKKQVNNIDVTTDFSNPREIALTIKDDDNNSDLPTPKDNKEISSESLQNPSDPDATYRYKYSDNIGYTVNLFE